MRKLSRKNKNLTRKKNKFVPKKINIISRLDGSIKRKRIRKIKKYRTKKCAFIKADGTQCKRYASGKGTLCKYHGGEKNIIKSNLVSIEKEKEYQIKPSLYDGLIHPIKYIELSREGLSPVEIASEFGVSITAINGWNEKFESFHSAYEIGKAMYEAWWLKTGKENLNTRGFNTYLYKFLTGNKLGYSDKIEQKSLNMNMHGVLMIPDKMTEDEWEKEGVIDVDS